MKLKVGGSGMGFPRVTSAKIFCERENPTALRLTILSASPLRVCDTRAMGTKKGKMDYEDAEVTANAFIDQPRGRTARHGNSEFFVVALPSAFPCPKMRFSNNDAASR